MSRHGLGAKRAAKARAVVAANRCEVRPGITHHWRGQKTILWPGDREGYEFTCIKCGETDSPS